MAQRARDLVAAAGSAGNLNRYREDILAGLTAERKHLSPTYFYDERGSQLFDEICTLPEYYATRTELALLASHAVEIAELAGPGAAVIELGAGSSVKARLLLAHLRKPASYLPVDISAGYLTQQAAEVAAAFPSVVVHPVAADFTAPFELPFAPPRERTLVFFPGSTIGNLSRLRAAALLKSLAERFGGSLLIGVDACSDARVLHTAYNDSQGVTAAFNLNVLERLNRELNADFDLDRFDHVAVYDSRHSRVEMRLVSRHAQRVSVDGVPVGFEAGEYIVTEHSHKYSPAAFAALAASSGWLPVHCWLDASERFSLQFFRATSSAAEPVTV